MSDTPQIQMRNFHILEKENEPTLQRLEGCDYPTIGSEIKCDENIFDSYHYDGWKDIHYDLLIVCAGVEYADRRWGRGILRWARHLHVTVPVLQLSTWQNPEVEKSLCTALRHLTGDQWKFTFVQSKGTSAPPRQGSLLDPQKEFTIAYSDGLDSLSVLGLYNENNIAIPVRLVKPKKETPKNKQPFDRLPFDVSVKQSNEDSQRSRGFKFAALSAIAAQLSKVSRIIVPESGQGALGPVLLPLLKIYPDYRNHPTFFRLMEHFINTLLETKIRYEQPRLWYTKGQTIAESLKKSKITTENVIKTRSCWQQRHNVRFDGKFHQCGICAACLLRRMSLHAANVSEPNDTYTIADLKAAQFSDAVPKRNNLKAAGNLFEYGCVGTRHLQQLAAMSSAPDTDLEPHAFELANSLGITMDNAQKKLRNMLRQHSAEWQAFAADQGDNSFLKIWTKGGRYDRSE